MSTLFKQPVPSEEYHSRFHTLATTSCTTGRDLPLQPSPAVLSPEIGFSIRKRKFGSETIIAARNAGMRSWIRNNSAPIQEEAASAARSRDCLTASQQKTNNNTHHVSPLASRLTGSASPSRLDQLKSTLPDSMLTREDRLERRVAQKTDRNIRDVENSFLRPSSYRKLSAAGSRVEEPTTTTLTTSSSSQRQSSQRNNGASSSSPSALPDDLKNDNDDTLNIVEEDNGDDDNPNNDDEQNEEKFFKSRYAVPSSSSTSTYRNTYCSSSENNNNNQRRPQSARIAQKLYQDRAQHRIDNSVSYDDPFGTNRYSWRDHLQKCGNGNKFELSPPRSTNHRREEEQKVPLLQAEQNQAAKNRINKTMRPLSAVAARTAARF